MLQIDQLMQPTADKSEPGASFARPLELLGSCHDKILHFSSALETLATTLHASGWDEQLHSAAGQIRRYFNISGPAHHLDEEQHLFPAIIALDPQFKQAETMAMVQLINRLIEEHVHFDLLWEALDDLLARQSEDFDTIAELAQQFAADMHAHVSLENETILPFAKAHLNDTQLKQIGADIARRRKVPPEQGVGN